MSRTSIFQTQRNKSNIDPVELSKIIFDGEKRYNQFLELADKLNNLLELTPEIYEMSREELSDYVLRSSVKLKASMQMNYTENNIPEETNPLINFHPNGSVGLLMTVYGLFIMATEDQKKAWLPSILKHVWATCYAQTELGHGTDVQSLQTTATFDPKTQQFTIHTPTLQAAKWWPGDLGLYCSHALVMAQLYSNGKCYGIQPFFMPVRDYKTHEVCPGVEIGDIGPKLGYNSKDNGYMIFNKYKVPVTSLLGRFIEIDAQGNVLKKGNPKVMYSSLMKTRSYLVCAAYSSMFKSMNIAVRYSLLRKQFKDKDGEEIPIYNYQLQREKLFSHMAKAYAMSGSFRTVRRVVKQNEENGKRGDFSLLQQAHILLSGYKAVFTAWDTEGAVKMIQACGGHGYSHYSGLPIILIENFASTILEGENSVLLLQVARSLLKAAQKIQAGELDTIQPGFQYLTQEDVLDFEFEETEEALNNPENLISCFAKISAFHLRDTSLAMFQHISNGVHPKTAWDQHMGSRLVKIGRLHTLYSIVKNFWAMILTLKNEPIRSAYTALFKLFTIQRLEEIAAPALAADAVASTHFLLIQNLKEQLYDELTPHGLILAEGIPFTDKSLCSAIAAENEQPYQNLYNWANKYGQLNKHRGKPHPNVVKHWLPFSKSLDQKLTEVERSQRAKL